MKKGRKLLGAVTAVGAVAGLIALKKYWDSDTGYAHKNTADTKPEESDFVPMEESDDDFDYVIENADQIMFYE